MLIVTTLLLVLANLVNPKNTSWQVRRKDVFESEFSLFVAESEPERSVLLAALNRSLLVELVGLPSDYSSISWNYTLGQGEVYIKIKYLKSIEATSMRFTMNNHSVVLTSGEVRNIAQTSLVIPLHSHFIEDSSTTTAKYTSIALRAISILGGGVMMANSVLKLNGLLLLKFAQMLDFINFIGFINVNYREGILETLTQVYKVSQNNFLFIPIPLDFDEVNQKFASNKGRLTELRISPILLENQLAETILLLGTYLFKILLSGVRKKGCLSKLANFAASLHFSIVQLVVVEQFFYASYQLNTRYNFETMIWQNFLSLICAFASISVIIESFCEASLLISFSKLVKVESKSSEKLDEPEELKFHKLSHPTHIIEFIQADISTKKLNYFLARVYNLLFVMRFLIIGLALSLCQLFPLLQAAVIAIYSLMFFGITLIAGMVYGVFASKWAACQRLVQETLISGMFGILLALAIDDPKPYANLEVVGRLSLSFVCLMAIALIIEVIFFVINLIKSIILAIVAICRWCNKPKSKKPVKKVFMANGIKPSGKKGLHSNTTSLMSSDRNKLHSHSRVNSMGIQHQSKTRTIISTARPGSFIKATKIDRIGSPATARRAGQNQSADSSETCLKGFSPFMLETNREANHARLITMYKSGDV